MVVGREAIGKTSLVRYLITGKARDENEKKTRGVQTHHDISVQDWSEEGTGIKVHVWDFGGQHMMQGTHRYFLTQRSLYLLVLEDRREDDQTTIHHWLRIIRDRGANAPTVVVINKSDNGKEDLKLPEEDLKNRYPQIVAFIRTSCDPGDYARWRNGPGSIVGFVGHPSR